MTRGKFGNSKTTKKNQFKKYFLIHCSLNCYNFYNKYLSSLHKNYLTPKYLINSIASQTKDRINHYSI